MRHSSLLGFILGAILLLGGIGGCVYHPNANSGGFPFAVAAVFGGILVLICLSGNESVPEDLTYWDDDDIYCDDEECDECD